MMLVMTPVQCGSGKDDSIALARSLKAKFPWKDAGYSNKTTNDNEEHSHDNTYTDVSGLHRDWADASLQCW